MTHGMVATAGNDRVEVLVESTLAPMPWTDGTTCGAGRILSDRTGTPGQLALFLLSGSRTPGETLALSGAEVTPAPIDVEASTAVLAPAVARALWMWDRLGLELGELAVLTSGHPLSMLSAAVAGWYGAQPLVLESTVDGVVQCTDGGRTYSAAKLGTRLAESPGIAAADLSGSPEMVDVLLEALPRFTRLFLAGASRQPLTIDFYVNVHRKGITLFSGVLDPAAALTARADRAVLGRALRLLGRPARAAECRAAMADGQVRVNR